jgi:hypothetical protein
LLLAGEEPHRAAGARNTGAAAAVNRRGREQVRGMAVSRGQARAYP